MKKTPIQMLITKVNNEMKYSSTIDAESLLYNLKILLELEKEMIIEAFQNGENKSAELYYKETYGNNISVFIK